MWSLDEPNSNNLSAARTLIPKVIRALPKYAPDLIVLLGLYLLLLGRWKKQGRRRVLVYTVFSVYMLGVLWVTVLPVLSMPGIHHAYAPMVLEPFRDLRLGYGNAERHLIS